MTIEHIDKSIENGKLITKRLDTELQTAQSAWAHFEAFNGDSPSDRANFRSSINSNGLGKITNSLAISLVNYTTLVLCRISDPEGKTGERLTLCNISRLLQNQSVRSELLSKAHEWTPHLYKVDPAMADINVSICQNAMQLIETSVTPGWATKPPRSSLFDWRNEVKPLRDAQLAHLLSTESIPEVTINKIRHGLEIATDLVHSSNIVFWGHSSAKDRFEVRHKEALTFWNFAEKGFKNHSV